MLSSLLSVFSCNCCIEEFAELEDASEDDEYDDDDCDDDESGDALDEEDEGEEV